MNTSRSLFYLCFYDIDLSPIRCHSSTRNGEKKVVFSISSLLPTPQSSPARPAWKPYQASQRSSFCLQWIQSTPTLIEANNKFPCLPYERTLVQCLNNYGVNGAYQVPECFQMAKYFDECVTINKYFGTIKRWNPEHFAENEYSRERPNLKDIGLWLIHT